MTKINKLALLAGVVGFVASANATAYNGDLFIGFYDGVGNDVLYDLGAITSITDGANSDLATVTSTFTLSGVHWGVVGNSLTSGNSRLLYTTFDTAPGTAGAQTGNYVSSADTVMYNNFPAAGAGQHFTIAPAEDNSWTRQTLNPTLPTQYQTAWENPNTTGITSFNLWKVQANSSAPVL